MPILDGADDENAVTQSKFDVTVEGNDQGTFEKYLGTECSESMGDRR